jgi:ADP-ribosylglycohydrolase
VQAHETLLRSAAAERHAPGDRQRRIFSSLSLAVYADAVSGGLAATGQIFTLAAHLCSRGSDLDQDEFAAQLAANRLETKEHAPAGTQKMLEKIAQGEPWWQAAPALHDGRGSYGNGAVVRATAAGLLSGTGPGPVARLARRSAMVTHTHTDAREAAAVHATAVFLAAGQPLGTPLDPVRFIAALAGPCRAGAVRASLATALDLAMASAPAEEAARVAGDGRTATGSVGAAMSAFLSFPDRPLDAVGYALRMGPAFAAAAVMTAAIAGVAYPAGRPPLTWSPPERLRALARATAISLAGAAPPSVRVRRPAGVELTYDCHYSARFPLWTGEKVNLTAHNYQEAMV